MICYICKKKIKEFDGCGICMDCVEASYLSNSMTEAISDWVKSLTMENYYWENAKHLLKNEFKNINYEDDLENQLNQGKNLLINIISHHLMYYRKEDIIVGLLSIKERCRKIMINPNNGDMWKYTTEYYMSVQMLRLIINKDKNSFYGAPVGHLENGFSNLITAIALERFLIILDENINNYKYFDCSSMTVFDLTIELLENDNTKKYYEKYLEIGDKVKPEDYDIKSESLEKKLELESKSLDMINKMVYNLLYKNFGFGKEEVENAIKLSRKDLFHSNNIPLSIYSKKILKESIKNYSDFDNFLKFLSVTRDLNSNIDLDRQLELRSFYEIGDYLIFGNLDFIQNISALEKFISSGHFIEYFDTKINVKECQRIQKKLSARLSYVLSEKFHINGYLVPLEKASKKLGKELIQRAEINKIIVNGQNILSQIGDIDVIAVDKEKKEIFLIELKHYKPAINSYDLFRKDKMKIEDKKVLKKILKRQKKIEENIIEVGNFFGWELSSDFKVKSIFVTSRVNYYAINEMNKIDYYTYASLINKINSKSI